MKRIALFTTALLSTSLLASGAFAAEKATSYPNISGEAVFELQLEGGVDSDDNDNERVRTFGRTEVAPTLQLTKNFYIDGVGVFEPVNDPNIGRGSFFEQEGGFIEELKLNYENGPYKAFAGKFNPGFGIAWDYGRGIWSEDFAEDYEITEKLGFGGSYTLETANAGSHTFTASTFFADTTFLSNSTITQRGRTRESDGGASNTEDFSSYVFALDGANVGGIENLSYSLGYRHLEKGDEDVGGKDENGVVANLNYVFPLTKNIESDVLAEFATIDNFGGLDVNSRYYTASVVNTIYDDWNVTIGYTKRETDITGLGDFNDHLLQVSGGYDFGNGLTLEAGWRNSEEFGTDIDILGALARYTVAF